MENYIESVRNQYEDYPYPLRDPEDEQKRLLPCYGEYLGQLSHYLFRGKQDFEKGFRVLIAGCGTGDALVYIGEQLRGKKDAEIVCLDISQASMAIARKRADIRGFTNVSYIHDSLLNLPCLDLGKFDYINCTGVLHHLKSPSDGLHALKSVLKEQAAGISIMIYGRYGRTGVYQIQELMRLVNGDEADRAKEVENTKIVLGSLPETNWFQRAGELLSDHKTDGDIGIYDLFLHKQDRSYSIPEMYEFIDNSGLNFVEFTIPVVRHMLKPDEYIKDHALLERIAKYDNRTRQAIAELIIGNVFKHIFYVSNRKDTIASLDDLSNVPYFVTPAGDLYDMIDRNPGQPVTVTHPQGMKVKFWPRRYTKFVLKYINGNRSLKEVFDCVREELKDPSVNDEELLTDFRFVYDLFSSLDWMLLRDKSIAPYPTFQKLSAPMKK